MSMDFPPSHRAVVTKLVAADSTKGEAAGKLLRTWRRKGADAYSDSGSTHLRRNDRIAESDRITVEIERITRGFAGTKPVDANDPTLKELKSELAEVKQEMQELSASMSEKGKVRRAYAGLAESCEAYVRDNVDRLKFAAPVKVEPRPGETVRDAVERERRTVLEIRADIYEVENAPVDTATAKKLALAQLDQMALAGRPQIGSLLQFGRPVVFPKRTERSHLLSSAVNELVAVEMDDATCLLAHLFKPQLAKALVEQIVQESEGTDGLNPEERAGKIAAARKLLLEAEKREAALMLQDPSVLPRVDLDPRAALSLSDAMPAPKGNA